MAICLYAKIPSGSESIWTEVADLCATKATGAPAAV